MNAYLRKIVDHRDESTLAVSFRRKRFELFQSFIAPLPKPLTILDVGGEQRFWEIMRFVSDEECRVTLMNIYPLAVTLPNFQSRIGDATELGEFADREFDLVFSNSVIEHLGAYSRQAQMAHEVQRVGKHYFVQTPNKHFPLEPHFLVPFFQFFPFNVQVALVRRFDLGWYQRIPDMAKARRHIRSHRLLTEREMLALFPGGNLHKEKVFGLTKSFIVYGSVPKPG